MRAAPKEDAAVSSAEVVFGRQMVLPHQARMKEEVSGVPDTAKTVVLRRGGRRQTNFTRRCHTTREAARVDRPEVVPLRGLGTGGGLCSGNEFIIIEMRE